MKAWQISLRRAKWWSFGLGAEVAAIAVDAIKFGPAGRAGQFAAFDAVRGLARGHRAVQFVEHVELQFQPDAHLVGHALRLQGVDGFPDDMAQVLVEVRLGADVQDVADEIQYLGLRLDRVEKGEAQVRLDQHVRAFHGGETQARGVDADPLLDGFVGEIRGGYRHAAKPAVDVRHVEGDKLDPLLFRKPLYRGHILKPQHPLPPSCCDML